jgi:hypothetical protein
MDGDVESVDALSIVTDKRIADPYGDRVWLLSGRGNPRTFVLRSWFVVDSVESGANDGYETKLAGKSGEVFDPVIELNREPWFEDFKREQGNFGFGFNRIKDRFAKALEEVAKLRRGQKKIQSHSTQRSIHISQQQKIVKLILLDGAEKEAVATGNNAAWLCVCGRKLPLLGRTGRKALASDGFKVICSDCSRQYHVIPEGKDLGRVLEVRETRVGF